MIVRTWRGATRAADAPAYAEYIRTTGIAEYEATPGNRGTLMLHRIDGDRAEFLILSWWESLDAIHAFAGDDIETAVFYPEDDAFLIDRELSAQHWQIDSASVGPRSV